MAKKKVVKKSAVVNGAVANKLHSCSWRMFCWGILILLLKTFGLAFLVQGFVLQLSTGILYYGLIHYAIGLIFIMLGWHSRLIAKDRCK